MTDISDSFDKFSMPCDIPDDCAEGQSSDRLRPPPSRGRTGDYGVPTQDWLSRGLKHKAGRGWEAVAVRGKGAADAEEDPDYGLSYEYGHDP